MSTAMNGVNAIKTPVSERSDLEDSASNAVLSEVVMHLNYADIVVTTLVDGSVMVNGELVEQVRK